MSNGNVEKKAALVEMCKAGEPRPVARKFSINQLAKALDCYNNPDSAAYDPEFTEQIRKLAPNWFAQEDGEKKAALLHLAQVGCDPKFAAEIRELAPCWFKNTTESKAKLIGIARSGGSKPLPSDKLGGALASYICRSGGMYDPSFDATIRKLAPQWFI